MKSRLRPLAVCAVSAVLVLTSACSGEEPEPGPGATGTGTAGGSATAATPSGEASSAPSPEQPSTPEVEPATGPDLTQTNLTVRAPQGWTLKKEGDPFSGQATDGLSAIFVTEIEDFGDGLLDLRTQAQIALDSGPYLQKPKILDPVEIDGRQWYHLSGPMDRVRHVDAYGTSEDGVSYSVDISLNRALFTTAPQRRALVDSVLASIAIG